MKEFIGFLITVTFLGFFGSFVIWAAWDVIFEIVPAAKGIINESPSLWTCFKLSWLLSFTIKGGSSSSSS